jgi:hypothetical protein
MSSSPLTPLLAMGGKVAGIYSSDVSDPYVRSCSTARTIGWGSW